MRLAADALERRVAAADPGAAGLLEALEHRRADAAPPFAAADPHDLAMLRFAAGLDDIFRLDSLCAPGLAFFGARVAGVSVAGRGLTLRAAFDGCVGEAIEYVSQWERDDDALAPGDLAGLDPVAARELKRMLAQCEGGGPQDWTVATRLSDGRAVRLPAEICLRRPPHRRAFVPPFLLGSGTAAGRTLEAATQHAVLELIERDALGLWWKGGRRGLAVDGAPAGFEPTLAALRRGRAGRPTWLLDITSDLAAPCVVAVSASASGERFAFGVAARLSLADAARAALLEVAQMELAYDLVEAKLAERGEAALNAADRLHLRRVAINAKTCALTQPSPPTRAHPPLSFAALVAHASNLGVEFHRLDLTRPEIGVAAARVVAPALQLEPSELVSERLAAAVAETGGGDAHTNGTALL